MDLYWFQGGSADSKVKELFDRLTPLWIREPDARKGLSLCIGWLYDAVLYWNGRLEDQIATCQAPTYEAWTYRRVKELVGSIKQEACRRKVSDFHVGLILLGGETMAYNADMSCEGWSGRTEEVREKAHYNIRGKWFYEHPEVDRARYGTFYFGSDVKAPEDEAVCQVKGPTFGEYFADKLCDMCKNTGFDAVILRDSVFTPAYVRGNRKRYMEPENSAALNKSFISLFARIKALIPGFIIIGYDSGTSSMEEWRSHGFDLEQVANSGYLDLWITQTWASAWQDYWPAHSMGYTFQLSNLLVNLAMLAKSPCRHMFLIETFDAWEPWDSIHQYPSKVAWEIWAYSHAALRMPGNVLKGSEGCYISWMNRGFDLIPEETVKLLCTTMDACAADLLKKPVPGGPCLVYHRKGLEYLLRRPESYSRGEEMDDWISMLQKYGVPVLSITRSEWLRDVEADALIFPAPAGIGHALCSTLRDKIDSGIPVLFTGQAGLLPAELRDTLSLAVEEDAVLCDLPSAAAIEEKLGRIVGAYGLQVRQHQRSMKENDGWDSLIRCLGGPIFAKHKEKPCFLWETPEWGTPGELHLTSKSIGSPQTYYAVSSAFGGSGWGPEGIRWENEDWQKPVCFLFWRYQNGEKAVLLGNLETGTTGNSQFAVKGTLGIQAAEEYTCCEKENFGPGYIKPGEAGFRIAVAPHKACIVNIGLPKKKMVSYDQYSYRINDRRIWLTSGELHYFRVPAGLWRDRLYKAKRAGLNCISTYMAWNFHEPEEGQFDFSGDKDIEAFIRLAGEVGLYVILRPGPYICSEWDFGGFPAWLAGKAGIQYRTDNAIYTFYYKRFFMRILPELARMDAAHGGNIILVQNENEHLMPCVPGRTSYFADINRCFEESGFQVPVINCNRLFEGKTEAGNVECVNTWEDPAGDIARMRSVQPDAPILVTELWCGGLDSWGRQHQTKHPLDVARKVMEILGSGGQVNYYMWHGGTNFGFWGGRLQYDPFYHIITSYDLDSPLAEGGEPTEKYYATKIVNMLSDSMGAFFAGKKTEIKQMQGMEGIKGWKLSGTEGEWMTFTNGGDTCLTSTHMELEEGCGLEISLEPFGAVILPVNVQLTRRQVVNYANLMPLGFFGECILVFHGPVGWHAKICINGTEKRETVSGGCSPKAMDFDGLTVLIVNTDLAGRCWWLDNKLVIGPEYVGETEADIRLPEMDEGFYEMNIFDRVLCGRKSNTKNADADLPELKDWSLVNVCREPAGEGLEWVRTDGPSEMSALGVNYGYCWYRLTIDVEDEQQYGLFPVESCDRLAIYLNGRYIGTWGHGPGAVRTPLPALLRKGRNTLTMLADNLGRFSHSWRMGEKKGVYGHIYHAVPLVSSKPVIKAGGEFKSSLIPSLPGHLNEDDHLAELVNQRLWTGSIEFSLDVPVPVYGVYCGNYSVLVLCNGEAVGFYENPGQGFADFILKEQLKAGKNRVDFLMWGDVRPDALNTLTFHALLSNLSKEGLWEFKPWEYPAERRDDCRGMPGNPAWFETRFKSEKPAGPIYLKIHPSRKGQIFFNGRNAGRYWNVGPQDSYYLPECWFKEENELRIFDEKGIPPEGAMLVKERRWDGREGVSAQLDVL